MITHDFVFRLRPLLTNRNLSPHSVDEDHSRVKRSHQYLSHVLTTESIMASSIQKTVTDAAQQVTDQFHKLSTNQQYAVAVAGGLTTVYMLSKLAGKREASSDTRTTSFELTGGSIAKGNVKKEFQEYAASFGKDAGQGQKQHVTLSIL